MKSNKIRQKFIKYFKKNKHVIVDSSSLWPHDDPSVLLTTAGMQQFKPYFMGIKDPITDFKSAQLASIQKCLRTSDIEEVGDATHNTFFEMMGNFSVNDYFKEEAIKLAWDFLIKELKFDKNKLWATYFNSEKKFPTDTEAIKIWGKYLDKEKIIGFGENENWWGPAGDSGPCGPSSEIHFGY